VLSKAYFEDVLYDRKRAPFTAALLFLLSFVYRAVVRLRLLAYSRGLFRSRRLPIPVISVGNITIGGTGKTPAVILIAGILRSRGKRPVILSRGYGRKDESSIEAAVGPGADCERIGDEPALMAARLKDIPVVVGRDRLAAGREALDRYRPDVAVLDDGFQHLRLARDLDIVLIDGADPFGSGKLFPAGILREPLRELRRADAVVITRSDRAKDLGQVRELIRECTAAPVFTSRHAPAGLADLRSGEVRQVASLRGAPVFAFAGIARPEGFFALLAEQGALVKGSASYADHHRYTMDDLASLYRRSADSGAVMLVTTEKDGIKLRDMQPEGIWALRIEMEVLEKDAWEEVLLRRL
jgi:tetraacyldisaccharide 4'-kinase